MNSSAPLRYTQMVVDGVVFAGLSWAGPANFEEWEINAARVPRDNRAEGPAISGKLPRIARKFLL